MTGGLRGRLADSCLYNPFGNAFGPAGGEELWDLKVQVGQDFPSWSSSWTHAPTATSPSRTQGK